MKDESIQTEVWRKAMNEAAATVQRLFESPPRRAAGETLTRYIDRVQDQQTRAVVRWKVACEHYWSCVRGAQGVEQ